MFEKGQTQNMNNLLNREEGRNDGLEKEKYVININKFRPSNPVKIPKENYNKISTSKYTWYNCIPKILFEQFSKMSNIYFLIIAVMQCFKAISNANGKPIILMPLAIVVAVNGIKDFIEDWKRKKSDDEENNRPVLIYNLDQEGFEQKTWQEVTVGSIIKVKDKEFFPADCVLISSSEPHKNCYVETKNLDGETNLKFKKSLSKFVNKLYPETNKSYTEAEIIENERDLKKIQGTLTTKKPNEFIYEFNAFFDFPSVSPLGLDSIEKAMSLTEVNEEPKEEETTVIIDNNSFLLRGSSLQQTEFIYGMVVYVGHNTKIMKNSPSAQHKISTIEHIMNMQIIFIFILQAILSLLGAAFCVLTIKITEAKIDYLEENYNTTSFTYFLIKLGTWTVLLNNLVPISLLVTLEMVKYVQGMFISWDYQIYDIEKQSPAKVQTSTLNEELGQVKYIFSDKTGTLTKNYMKFKKMAIGKYDYGTEETHADELQLNDKKEYSDDKGKITNFAFEDPVFKEHLSPEFQDKVQKSLIDLFLTALGTCHSVIVNEKLLEQNIISYQSSSPDEAALVNCARNFNYVFTRRDINNNIFLSKNGEDLKYSLLCNFEYSSERKRMSVVIRGPDNKIYLFIKGADSVILPRVTQNSEEEMDKMNDYLRDYAKRGLRTLVVAYREMGEEEYKAVSEEYLEAMKSTYQKDKKLNELCERVETNLYLLGITGIEDQLQENVGEVLHSFNEAGIKIWVLTGDKKETAKSIAYSCQLLNNDTFTIFDFKEGLTKEEILDLLKQYTTQFNTLTRASKSSKNRHQFAILISQDELKKVLHHKSLLNIFYELANRCHTVLCCRVTPKQKAQVVHLIKDRQPQVTTLAIGDGANDVNMITSANIGIGITGVEGKQAARASDYAIGEFQFLKRLLFVHGRESYRKNSFVVCYNFYKNFLFVIPQFILGFESLFGGQTIYDSFIYQLYNILFAAFPIMWFGIYDRQVSDKKLESNPKYYTQGILGRLFKSTRFWKWIFYGTIQAVIVYIYSFHLVESPHNTRGDLQDLSLSGSIAYSAVIVIVNVKVFQTTWTHSLPSIILLVVSTGLYYAFMGVQSLMPKYYNFGNAWEMLACVTYYLKILLMVLICLMMDLGIKTIFKIFGCIPDPLEVNVEDIENKSAIDIDKKGENSEEEMNTEIELSEASDEEN